jgi:hypothetical protein
MDTIVAILIWTVMAVLVAPLIFACVFLSDWQRFLRIDHAFLLAHCPEFLLNSEDLAIRKLQSRYGELQYQLIGVRAQLAKSLSTKDNVKKRISDHQAEGKNPQSMNKDADSHERQEQFRKWQAELALLEKELSQNEEKCRSLRKELGRLEDEAQAADSAVKVETAKRHFALAERAANGALSRLKGKSFLETNSNLHLSVIDRMEKKILEREVQIARDCELVAAGRFVPKPPGPRTILLLNINRVSSVVSTALLSCRTKLAEVMVAVDPSVARALARLQLRFEQARTTADMSMAAELELENSIVAQTNQRDFMRDSADGIDVTDGRKFFASARATSLDQSVKDLGAGLELIKTKNLSVQQTLFYVDAIVRRLSILALLIPAIPSAKKNVHKQFIELANQMCAYLQVWTASQNMTALSISNDLVERLNALEQNTLMSYIKIAKGETDDLNQKSFERLQRDVQVIATALELERTDAASELEKWAGIGEAAEQNNKLLLVSVAQNRQARCAEIIKLAEQTQDVLNITISLAEARVTKTKAG